MRIGIGSIHHGIGAAPPPLACSSIVAPSSDPAVFMGDPSYIKNINLQADCQQADRVNKNLAAGGFDNFVGVDQAKWENWWARYMDTVTPGKPTYGQDPPPQDYWTGVDTSNIFETVFLNPRAPVMCGDHPCTNADMFQPTNRYLACIGTHHATPGYCADDGTFIASATGPSGATPYVPPSYGGNVPVITAQPTTQQLVAATTTPVPPISGGPSNLSTGASSNFLTDSSIVSTVPNWALLGAAAVALFMFMGKH